MQDDFRLSRLASLGPLNIASNVQLFRDDRAIRTNDSKSKFGLSILLIENETFRKMFESLEFRTSVRIGSYVFAFPESGAIYYRRKFLGQNLYMMLSNVTTTGTQFWVSKSVTRTVKLPLDIDLPRLQDMVNALLLTKLAQIDWLVLHAALVESPSGGLIISGYRDTGKTTTAFILSGLERYKALSDDITLVQSDGTCDGGGACHQASHGGFDRVPVYTIAGLTERGVVKSSGAKFLSPRRTFASILQRLSFLPCAPDFITKIANELKYVKLTGDPQKIVTHSTNARYLLVLQTGRNTLTRVDEDTMLRKLMAIQRTEFYWFWSNFLLSTYSYIDHEFDFEYLERRYYELLRILIRKISPELYVVQASAPEDFSKLILGLLQEKR